MPGKQMAIDADVHAGALDADGARRKRALIQKEADFYGAMDGAGKFVKGDAVAALVIVALNLVGGIVVGVAQTVGAHINPEWQLLSGHIAFLIVLVIRPRGLFPRAVD
jgi:flagellar biosynthesis component FlhA